ncbi:MAG: helix-turn-helix domain-containing protein [Oscillospiraceae bacterium]|nr:helix-turn-helix domain-containing protein [Oscillospiraceae bacterium]
MQIGGIISKMRIEAGLTQSQLADALYVSRDLVSKWETGQRLPEYRMVEAMASLFGVQPDDLVSKDSILLDELSALFPEDRSADAEMLRDVLNAFLSTISQRDASVFVRRYYFLEDPDEIGRKYGIRENYVRTILMRTRKKLRKYLEEQ